MHPRPRAALLLMLWTGSVSSEANVCADQLGEPPLGAGLCASYAGRCDDSALSTKQKATLLWRCPRTCAGTDYADGGVAYCPCIAGHDCCFDEPPDCSTRRMTSVIEQVLDTTSILRTVLLAQSHPQHAPAYLGPCRP